MSSDLTFSNVESQLAKPATIRTLIGNVFKANNDECFLKCRPYLQPPGIDGSAQFDHCEVVNLLLEYDRKLGKNIASYMIENTISKSALWRHVANTLKRAGFDVQNGRVVGLLEGKERMAAEQEAA